MVRQWMFVLGFSLLFLAGCSAEEDSPDPAPPPGDDSTPTTTSLTGRVTFSGIVKQSSSAEKMAKASQLPKGSPVSEAFALAARKVTTSQSLLSERLPTYAAATQLSRASVLLYDAEHPEWLYPVAMAFSDSAGNYSLETLTHSAENGLSYVDGDPIPAGKYTLIAIKSGFDFVEGVVVEPLVAVRTVVSEFAGAVLVDDLEAKAGGDSLPDVVTLFGQRKNRDGTRSWGGETTQLATNTAIQVSFSEEVARASVGSSITISPAVDGYWAVAADWKSATFYLNPGVRLLPAEVYTVTIQGGVHHPNALTSVYGNRMAESAIGRFTVMQEDDLIAPVVQLHSPSSEREADVITPIQLRSNEPLDVNSLELHATPSLGGRSALRYVGEVAVTVAGIPGTEYLYEFVLGETLRVSTRYEVSISGGTDLAANPMSDLSFHFSTKSAADIQGVDATASVEMQNDQAAVRGVFGDWLAAMNNRDLAHIMDLMSSDFMMEYDAAHGLNVTADANRDGRMSRGEFSTLLEGAFNNWDQCQTILTGEVNELINVVGNVADFAFTLYEFPEVKSAACVQEQDVMALYASLSYSNGAWLVSRLSLGIDSRERALVLHDVMQATGSYSDNSGAVVTLASPAHGDVLLHNPYIDPESGAVSHPLKFQWRPYVSATGEQASAYIFLIYNDRESELGRAFVLPSAMTSSEFPLQTIPADVVELHSELGFDTTRSMRLQQPGEQFHWAVMALTELTPTNFRNGTASNFFDDISAVTKLHRYKNAGQLAELEVAVKLGSATLDFNELIGGYDAGNAGTLTLQVSVADSLYEGVGVIDQEGHSSFSDELSFVDGVAEVTVDLYQGSNWFVIWDGGELYRSFNIATTGGITPVIDIVSVQALDLSAVPITAGAYVACMVDATPPCIDMWGYLDTKQVYPVPDVASLILNVQVASESVGELQVNVWNNSGASFYTTVEVLDGTADIDLPVFAGDNWINLSSADGLNTAYLGVNSATGTPRMPPVQITSVTESRLTDSYGGSSNWDASSDSDDLVVVSGIMQTFVGEWLPEYILSSDGGSEWGVLPVQSSGSFELAVSLHNGWNWLFITDAEYNWYGVNIYTENGQAVSRAAIHSLNGAAFNGHYEQLVDVCSVTIEGTSTPNTIMSVSLNGASRGYLDYFYESYTARVQEDGQFLLSFPIYGPVEYQYIDLYDQHWNWSGIGIKSSAQCAYVAPVISHEGLLDGDGFSMEVDLDGNYSTASLASSATVYGTSNIPGRPMEVSVSPICGGYETVYTVASQSFNVSTGGYDWSVPINSYAGDSWLDISDGANNLGFYLSSASTSHAPVSMQLTEVVDTVSSEPKVRSSIDDCASHQVWAVADSSSVTISGSTTAGDGVGLAYFAANVINFDIEEGVFSLDLDLINGINFVSIYDAAWNHSTVDLITTNGIASSQQVTITSPAHQATGLTGDVLVSGVVDSSFAATKVMAYVWHSDPGVSYLFSSSVADQKWGSLPLTYGQDGAFNFSVNIADESGFDIYVNVYDVDGNVHGHNIALNGRVATAYYKSGTEPKAKDGQAKQIPVLKRLMQLRSGQR